MKLKQKQIEAAIITGNHVKLDISTDKFPNTFMTCNLQDYENWKNNPTYGRICPLLSTNNNYPYAVFSENINGKPKLTYFHHHVNPEYKLTDHKDHVGLNNCRSNLRDGTECNQWNRSTSKNNTSGFTGVSFNKLSKKWIARIMSHKKMKCLGYFKTPEEASEAYQKAKHELHQIGA